MILLSSANAVRGSGRSPAGAGGVESMRSSDPRWIGMGCGPCLAAVHGSGVTGWARARAGTRTGIRLLRTPSPARVSTASLLIRPTVQATLLPPTRYTPSRIDALAAGQAGAGDPRPG